MEYPNQYYYDSDHKGNITKLATQPAYRVDGGFTTAGWFSLTTMGTLV
jgi:hypothetical protein